MCKIMSVGLDMGYEELLNVKISEEIIDLLIINSIKIIEKISWLTSEVMINDNIHPTSSHEMSSLYW